jgi:glycosyltransferase involved in cell wall biosynthesis/predicted SAM-dependent methyltransferase/polysaccharide pyruvyl transferase WcaK-like protein
MLKIEQESLQAINNYLESHHIRKLHLGAGPNVLDGWFNTDISPEHKGVYALDVTERLPFDDKSIDYILSEHLVEHLTYKDGLDMFRECFRILKPGGIIRVATPDLEILIKLHTLKKNEIQQQYIKWHVDSFLPGMTYNDCFVINNAFRGWGHQFIYDEETLRNSMEKVGFVEIKRYKPGESDDENFRGIEWRAKDEVQKFTGLILEARRPNTSLAKGNIYPTQSNRFAHKYQAIEVGPMSGKDDLNKSYMNITRSGVKILLCGYYFHGNTGDDLMMESIVKSLGKYGEIKVTGSFNTDEIDWCDILIIGGGTHIRSWNIGGYEHAKYAKERGKKVVYYANTIEDGHPLFEEHLRRADFITVRDSESKMVVERHGFRAILASDPVFVKKHRIIGFSFRRWLKEPPGVIEMLSSVLNNLSKDYDIVSIPYTQNETDTESDTSFHNRIIQLMKYKPEHHNYYEIIESIDLLIGMRLHALVEAVNMGKKVLAIDYDSKIGRILSDLSMGDMVVSYDEINKIPIIVREKIFRADSLAQREKVNEALIERLCADVREDKGPRVSVIMSTYNKAHLLKESIDSILSQTYNDFEFIIIDDGSNDATKEIVDSYNDKRIRYHNFGKNGIAFSYNIGNLLARGEIIVLSDPGSINTPDRLEKMYNEIEKNKADLVYSSVTILQEDGKKEFLSSSPFNPEMLMGKRFIYYPTVAYRQSLAACCYFNEDLSDGWDYKFFSMALNKGFKFQSLPDNTLFYRVQADDTSSYRIPVVSVIIPTCDRPDFLKEALQSVLQQTYQDFEIIVVNDGGRDVSDVMGSLDHRGKIVYLQQKEKKGPSAARNLALKAARGKYIAYLDDDDIYYSNHLETLVGFLEKGDFKVAYTDSFRALQTRINDRYVTTEKKVVYSFDFDRNRFLVYNYIHMGNICHRRELLDEVGLFDEELETHEDWELCIRLSQRYDFFHIKAVTAEFRIRDDKTNATAIKRPDFLRTLRLIHKRYTHLITDADIFEAQKKIEESLAIEVAIRQVSPEELFNQIELYIRQKDMQINNLESAIRDKDAHIGNLESHAKNLEIHAKSLEKAMEEKDIHIGNLETYAKNTESYARDLEAAIRDKDIHIQNIESLLKEKETTLNNIYRSRGWKALHTYYKLKGNILHLFRGTK